MRHNKILFSAKIKLNLAASSGFHYNKSALEYLRTKGCCHQRNETTIALSVESNKFYCTVNVKGVNV